MVKSKSKWRKENPLLFWELWKKSLLYNTYMALPVSSDFPFKSAILFIGPFWIMKGLYAKNIWDEKGSLHTVKKN
jgi:hypothetical protein